MPRRPLGIPMMIRALAVAVMSEHLLSTTSNSPLIRASNIPPPILAESLIRGAADYCGALMAQPIQPDTKTMAEMSRNTGQRSDNHRDRCPTPYAHENCELENALPIPPTDVVAPWQLTGYNPCNLFHAVSLISPTDGNIIFQKNRYSPCPNTKARIQI